MHLKLKFQNLFFREVSIAPLVVFRIIFGALMLFGSIRFLSKGWVYDLYILPKFHFTYYGFDWVKVLPGNWMYLPFILLIISSFGILLGAFYRIATIVFFTSFTYVELLDKTYYLNHYYFVSLISFLLIFIPANRYLSLDSYRKTTNCNEKAQAWHVWIIRFQLGVVYCFAGIAKINSDWLLEAQPLKIWLQTFRDTPLIGGLFATTFVAYLFSWFGCFYDLTIPFFLSNSKTRNIAYFFVVFFHILTWILFPIGIFPWVMIFCTLIFFPEEFHWKLIRFFKKILNLPLQISNFRKQKKMVFIPIIISIYLLFQVTFPFRHLLYNSNLFWTEQGFRFGWRVMLMQKEGYTTFYVRDRNTKQEIQIDNQNFLTESQNDQMATQPDFILQYAHFLHKKYKDTILKFGPSSYHLKNPSIHVESYVSLNGRPSKKYIDKKHDLSKIEFNLQKLTCLEPF